MDVDVDVMQHCISYEQSKQLLKTLLFESYWSTAQWQCGVVVSGVRRMNEVNARRARLVPGWVTVFGRVYHLGM